LLRRGLHFNSDSANLRFQFSYVHQKPRPELSEFCSDRGVISRKNEGSGPEAFHPGCLGKRARECFEEPLLNFRQAARLAG